jgi:hypothetical protein
MEVWYLCVMVCPYLQKLEAERVQAEEGRRAQTELEALKVREDM